MSRHSKGVSALFGEFRAASDSGDAWGDVMRALFCLCDELHCRVFVEDRVAGKSWDAARFLHH